MKNRLLSLSNILEDILFFFIEIMEAHQTYLSKGAPNEDSYRHSNIDSEKASPHYITS